MCSKLSNLNLSLVLLLVSFGMNPARAVQFLNTDTYVHMPEEILDEETWVFSTRADVSGTVEKDIFVYASNIVLAADFQDDVWAAGNVVSAGGTFRERPRILGGQRVKLSGAFANGIMAFSKTVQVSTNASFTGESYFVGEHILFEGTAEEKIYLAGTKVTIKGTISGDLRLIAEDIVLMPGTHITGTIFYTAPSELVPGKGVTVGGGLTPVDLSHQWVNPVMALNDSWKKLNVIFYINALFLGIVYIVMCSRKVGHAVRSCRQNPVRSFLIGFVSFFILPGIIQLLVMSRLGIPAAIGLTLLYIIGLYIGKILVALLIGGILFRLKGRQSLPRVLLSYTGGLTLLYLIFVLPALGFLAWFTVCSYGLGGWVLSHLEDQIFQPVHCKQNLNEKTDEPPTE